MLPVGAGQEMSSGSNNSIYFLKENIFHSILYAYERLSLVKTIINGIYSS